MNEWVTIVTSIELFSYCLSTGQKAVCSGQAGISHNTCNKKIHLNSKYVFDIRLLANNMFDLFGPNIEKCVRHYRKNVIRKGVGQ